LALHELCRKHEVYLKGNTVYAFTDHRSLVHLGTQPSLNQRQSRWVEYLQSLDLHIEYLPGKFNAVADLLSRSPKFAPLCERCRKVVACFPVTTRSQRRPVAATPLATTAPARPPPQPLPTAVEDFTPPHSMATHTADLVSLVAAAQSDNLENETDPLLSTLPRAHDLSRHRNLIYVPPDKSLRCQILSALHDPPSQGHQGVSRTVDKVRQVFSWPGLEEDVRSFVSSCDSCQRNKHATSRSFGFLQPLSVPFDRFSMVTMDPFFLPTNEHGEDMVLLVAEASVVRNVVLIPCRSTDTAATLARLFIRHWHDRGFGLPTVFVTDRDSRFTSSFWQGFVKAINATHKMATARHQQTDGLSERHIRTVKEVLRHYSVSTSWGGLLSSVEFALNNSTSSSTGFTPFFLMYGCHPRTLPTTTNHSTTHKLLLKSIDKARTSLERHKDSQARQYDKRHILPPDLVPNQLVLLSAEGIKKRNQTKLSPLWLGPFPIKCLHPPLNVELSLPTTWRIHPVFHVSRIKPYTTPNTFFPERKLPQLPMEPVLITDDEGEIALEWIVAKILDHKYSQDYGLLFRTHWLGYPPSESTWEPLTSFIRPFTQALLEYTSQLSDSARRGVSAHWPSHVKKPTSLHHLSE
jgi:hypothetical protein